MKLSEPPAVWPSADGSPDIACATDACYDAQKHRIVIELRHGIQLAIPVPLLQGLGDATSPALSRIDISPTGTGLHWPELDVDLYLPALLQGVFGTRSWMAGLLGQVGGRSQSDAKIKAARSNGRKGGRPRKKSDGA